MDDHKGLIRNEALRLGFDACGFANAETVDAEAQEQYARWLADGRNDCMDYASRYCDVRSDPRLLLPGAQTVISLASATIRQCFKTANRHNSHSMPTDATTTKCSAKGCTPLQATLRN